MTTIGLTKATRQTVTLLGKIAEDSTRTSQRLDTTKAVNSALDNPSAYFTAQSLTDQAAQIDRTVEQLGQGIQVISAAQNGLTSISSLLENARASASQAAASKNAFERMQYAQSYNDVLDQIVSIAKESSYGGKNLLLGSGHELSLYFGDNQGDKVTVGAFDYTNLEETLGLKKIDVGSTGIRNVTLGDSSVAGTSRLLDTSAGFSAGDVVEVRKTDPTTGNSSVIASLTVDDNTTVNDLVTTLTQTNDGLRANLKSDGSLEIEAATSDLSVTGIGSSPLTFSATAGDWLAQDASTAATDALKSAVQTIRQHSAAIGSNLAILQNRSDFMQSFSGTLQTNSSSLVSADKTEEAAKLLALQTQQQLATSALSISGSLDDGILRLLGG